MNEMQGMSQVLARINQIETRFHIKGNKTDTFQSYLVAQNPEQAQSDNAVQSADKSDIQKMLQIAARKYNVNPKLVNAIAKAESNFDQTSISSAGAVGVMQLMPQTASTLGVKNIYDARENIDGGVKYLKQMLDMFNGDATLAVAAYNAGPGAVKRYNGVPPFSETQQYVARVMTYMDK